MNQEQQILVSKKRGLRIIGLIKGDSTILESAKSRVGNADQSFKEAEQNFANAPEDKKEEAGDVFSKSRKLLDKNRRIQQQLEESLARHNQKFEEWKLEFQGLCTGLVLPADMGEIEKLLKV